MTLPPARLLSPLGYLVCLLGTIGLAAAAPGWWVAGVFIISLVAAIWLYPGGLDQLRRRSFWTFAFFLLVGSALFAARDEAGPTWGPISGVGAVIGVQMILRAATILIVVGGFTTTVSIGEVTALLERLGFPGLGFALGVALNMLPTIQNSAATTLAALRLRGGFRRNHFAAARQLVLMTIGNSLRYGEQIVSAAEVRAYTPERAARSRPAVHGSADEHR